MEIKENLDSKNFNLFKNIFIKIGLIVKDSRKSFYNCLKVGRRRKG